MKTIRLFTIISGLLLTSIQVNAQSSSNISPGLETEIESLLSNELFKNNRIKGGSVTIHLNGDTWSTHAGVKDSENTPIDGDAGFLFRSLTKTQTATIIFQLQEEGLLSINDPISNYIESIKNVPGSTTIYQLMTMTANTCNYLSNPALNDTLSANSTKYIEDTFDLLNRTNIYGNCNPNREYKYHDTNTQILGVIIETLTGNLGDSEFKSRIYEPLGLSSASLVPNESIGRNFNGVWFNINGTLIDYSSSSTNYFLSSQRYSGGSVMTTMDAMALLVGLFEGDIIQDESLDQMKNTVSASEGWDERWLGYGPGLMKFRIHNKDFYGHPGGSANKSMTLYNPEMKIGISLAANLDDRNERVDATTDLMIGAILECIDTGACTTTSDELQNEVAHAFTLSQNYPNPFNPSTNISFELPEAGLVQLKVYNLLGQEVSSLVDGRLNSGNHTVNFDASQLSSGVYIYRLIAGNQSITKKMMLIK